MDAREPSVTARVLAYAHMEALIGPLELRFIIILALALALGIGIGIERELRGKDAGISTHILVISGSALFSLLSAIVDPTTTSHIASGVVSGMGFIGAGIILRDNGGNVRNLTTAASLWMSTAIGMALGFGFYAIAIIAGIACILIPLIPSVRKREGV